MIYRFHAKQSVLAVSSCDRCSHPLAPTDLIPIFSWVSLRGKCRYCELPLSKGYLFGEIGLALVFASISYHIGISVTLLLILLGLITYADLKTGLIPNFLVLLCGFVALFVTTWDSVGLAMIMYLVANLLSYLFRKPSLGQGDVKFMGMAGLWLTYTQLPFFLILTGFGGILMALAMRCRTIPLGPSLCFALGTCVLLGKEIDLFQQLSHVLPF